MQTQDFNIEILNYKNELKHFALRLTSDKIKAQDLVQETYLKALANQPKYKAGTHLKAWMFTIMKNLFINDYRKEKRQGILLVDNEAFIINKNIRNNNNPESISSENDIQKLIRRLDQKFRIPFTMHIEGYKYKEISNELSLKIGTVKSRIHFARHQLIQTMSGHY